jgi:hypothetical protein
MKQKEALWACFKRLRDTCKPKTSHLRWIALLLALSFSHMGFSQMIFGGENLEDALSYIIFGGLIALLGLEDRVTGAFLLASIFLACIGYFFSRFLAYFGLIVVYVCCLKPFLDLSKSKAER